MLHRNNISRVLRLAALACCCAGMAAPAQVELEKPIHLAHVQGVVVDSTGKPVAHADVTLVKDGAVAYKTATNDSGAFHFEHVVGNFLFRIGRTQFAPAAHEIHVGDLIESYVQRKKLYVIVGPGACQDECSLIFTSKHEFERAIQKRNRK